MSVATRPYLKTGSVWTPKLDGTESLYLPLWHPTLAGASPIISKDKNVHSCTITGAVAGRYGRTFDAIDDQINCGSALSIANLFATTGGTLWAWIKPTSAGEAGTGIIAVRGNLSTVGWVFYGSAEASGKFKLTFARYTNNVRGDWITTDTQVSINVWSMVAVTYNDATLTTAPIIYVNGVSVVLSVASSPTGTEGSDSGSNFIIGGDGAGAYTADGIVGEVWGYKGRILTASGIMRKMQETQWMYNS